MAVWSIINKSLCLSSKRIDSERFKPAYAENELFLKSLPHRKLKSYVKEITGGATPLGANYPKSGIPFVRVQNIRANYIDLSDVVFIENKIHNGQLLRSQINEDDVLLTITGVSYGNSATAFPEILPANMNQHSVRIKLKDGLLPRFLSTFLNSKFGRLQSDSKITGDTRPALTYSEIGNYFMPEIDLKIQKEVSNIVEKSTFLRQKSQSLYQQATTLLENELGLDKINFEKPKYTTTSYSIIFDTRRVDAEFYNPELRYYYKYLTEEKGFELKKISKFIRVMKFSNPDYAEKGTPIITQKHLTNISPENYDGFPIASNEWVLKYPEAVIRENDLLFYSVGAYLGKTNIWFNDDKAVQASFITMLRSENKIDAGYLMVLLNSKYGILQSKVYQSGSSQPYIYPKDIRQFLIPLITDDLKQKLYDLIKQSFIAKKESQKLLEEAKNRLEELIEAAAKN